MSRAEKCGLAVVLAVGLGLLWGVGSGLVECGVFGAVVGAGLGAIIE